MPHILVSPEPFNHPAVATEPVYTFRLNQYRIAETRARHNDTDVIRYTVTVGEGAEEQSYPLTLPPADVNNGNHDICLELPGIKIPTPDTKVTVAFTIVNSGDNSAAIEAALQKGIDALIAAEGGKSLTTSGALLLVDAALAGFLTDCDGTVAADSLTVPRSSLDALIPANGRVQTHTKHYPGSGSEDTCGANSSYYVTQTIIRTPSGSISQPQADATFIIAGRSSGLVLDIPGGVATPDVAIQQYPDNGTPAQHWNLTPVEGEPGYFTIHSVLSGLFLEVAGKSKADHAKIQQGSLTGEENQQWKFEAVSVQPDLEYPALPSNGFYLIRSRSSGKVLDVPNDSAEPVEIQQFTAETSNNQLWQPLALDPGPPENKPAPPPPPIIE
jgi:hypothetical protein